MSIANFLAGLALIAAGLGFILKARYLNQHVWFLDFIENRFGPGQGITAYKILGLVVIVFAFFVLTGLFDLFADPAERFSPNDSSSPNSQPNPEVRSNPTPGSSPIRIAP